jgi:predicted NBD/HSP70 family sugar kinase/mannose-6-phosphate isomerase class I
MSEHLNKYAVLGVDIGGSHISAALVDRFSGNWLPGTISRNAVDPYGGASHILDQWTHTLKQSLRYLGEYQLLGIGVAMPGPFDYEQGISLMRDGSKYASLIGINVKEALRSKLALKEGLPVIFENDAVCFALGEIPGADMPGEQRFIAITLGTGFGAAFLQNGVVLKQGQGVPPNGELYRLPYLNGINEDYVSGRWILAEYNARATTIAASTEVVASCAAMEKDLIALDVFREFGVHLASCLIPWIKSFAPGCVLIGGSIAKSSQLFLNALKAELTKSGCAVPLRISEHMDLSAIKGAVSLVPACSDQQEEPASWRKSNQPPLPFNSGASPIAPGDYNMYPSHTLSSGNIFTGFESLADWLQSRKAVMIDGVMGNDWPWIRRTLSRIFNDRGVPVRWYDAAAFQLPAASMAKLAEPFVGKPGEVWGTRCTLEMADFFDVELFSALRSDEDVSLNIIIGTGAALAAWDDLVYFDLPKNEIQFRMRAGQPVSLLSTSGFSNPEIYKRLYFVDWVISKRHRALIQHKIKVIADGQWRDRLSWAHATTIFDGFRELARTAFRARPWFEPGAWGGQWLKNKIKGISQDETNYAWSFELIVPENGLVFASGNNQLEVAFDWMMDCQAATLLGSDYARFGNEFPIRFDYLDTMEGGNLSIQCHPSLSYIQRVFGENITQDETYYILDCGEDAKVHLGFQDDIDPAAFKIALQTSIGQNVPVAIDKYVQSHPAKKHDLFLIPNRTIHSAGRNNMVLEISATPYIFTFKLYDWLRPDLDGKPRPINIEHGFNNLDFSRRGEAVRRELISRQHVIEETDDYRIVHLPTHAEHFYDVHRIEFSGSVEMTTNGKCFVMSLVEGQSIIVTADNRAPVRFNYAETFIVPAGVRKFSIVNETKGEIKIIKAFVK